MHIISKNYIFISLFQKLLHSYVKEAAALGVSNMDAKMMCANFRHQGGASAVKRILAKTTKPYTLDHLYAACQTDTGNQVGAYKSRQKMVYNALKTHITNYKVTAAEAIQAAVKIAKTEIGYREKASNANLDSKTANAGTANLMPAPPMYFLKELIISMWVYYKLAFTHII